MKYDLEYRNFLNYLDHVIYYGNKDTKLKGYYNINKHIDLDLPYKLPLLKPRPYPYVFPGKIPINSQSCYVGYKDLDINVDKYRIEATNKDSIIRVYPQIDVALSILIFNYDKIIVQADELDYFFIQLLLTFFPRIEVIGKDKYGLSQEVLKNYGYKI